MNDPNLELLTDWKCSQSLSAPNITPSVVEGAVGHGDAVLQYGAVRFADPPRVDGAVSTAMLPGPSSLMTQIIQSYPPVEGTRYHL